MNESAFRIGVSGHQQLGDEQTVCFVAQQFCELLLTYRERALQHGQGLVAYSALALGADQLFSRTALELEIPVEVVLPCSRYEELFTSAEAHTEYHRLLARCQRIRRLSFLECSEDAYLAAGHWIVENSDLVLLVWNGYPAGGRGGTADVASYARLLRRPFLHLHTRFHTTTWYGSFTENSAFAHMAPKREYTVCLSTVYRGTVLAVN